MGEFGYSDYVAYRMKMSAISFVVMILGFMFYAGGSVMFNGTFKIMESITDLYWLQLSMSIATTAWAVVGGLWGIVLIYKDGK